MFVLCAGLRVHMCQHPDHRNAKWAEALHKRSFINKIIQVAFVWADLTTKAICIWAWNEMVLS